MIYRIKKGKVVSLDQPEEDRLPAHALFSPSGSEGWLECPGFAYLESEAGPAALKGREAHAREEEALNRAIQGEEASSNYSDYIMSILPKNGTVYVEEKFSFSSKFFGTVDCLIHDKDKNTVVVIDLKTGKYDVSPKYNSQLACYLLLFSAHTQIDIINGAWMVVFQKDEPKTWAVSFNWYNQIGHEIQNTVSEYQHQEKPKPEFFKPGPQCTSCFKRNNCPVYSKNMNKDIVLHEKKLNVPLSELPEDDFIKLWQMSLDIKKHVKSIENELKKRDENGTITKLEKVTSREVSVWKNKKEALKNEKFVTGLMTASEAKKIMTPEELDKFITKRKDTKWVTKDQS